MRRKRKSRFGPGQLGFSLPELLVVVAIVGIAVLVSVPLVSEQVRLAKIRGAADQLTMDLKAARMIAVSSRSTVDFTVNTDPTNDYQYTDARGKTRQISMPSGVTITSSTSPISFGPTGKLSSAATTVMEINVTGSTIERWTITTSILGVSSVTQQRI
jgi:prepilin-type N-terminal cleavage/methylation domain-containing protein